MASKLLQYLRVPGGAVLIGALITVGAIAVVFGGGTCALQDRVLRQLPFPDLPV
jgi:hypothetical protein